MSGCATTHALLSGFVSRLRREAWIPKEEDVRPLLSLGLAPAELEAALADLRTPGADEARRLAQALAQAPP